MPPPTLSHLALLGGQTGGLCEGPREGAPSLGSWVRDPPRQALGTPPARPAPSAAGPALPLSMVKAPGVIRLSLPPAEPHSYSNHRAAGPRTATLSGPSETQPAPPLPLPDPRLLAPLFLHFKLSRGGGPWENRVPTWTPGFSQTSRLAGGRGRGREEGGREGLGHRQTDRVTGRGGEGGVRETKGDRDRGAES